MVESQLGQNSLFTWNEAAAYATEGKLESKAPLVPPPTLSSKQFSSGESSFEIDASNLLDNSVSQGVHKLLSGELPSNQTMNEFLDKANRSLLEQSFSANLNSQGKRLIGDLRSILNSGKSFLNNTNADERLQKFLKEASEFTKDLADKSQYAAKKLERTAYDAKEEGKHLIYNLKDLLLYMIRSGDFRQLMDDFVVLFQNIGGKFERHKKEVKRAIKKDVNKEDTGATSTKKVLKGIQKEVQEGRIVDEKVKDRIFDRFEKLLYKLTSNKQYDKVVDNLFNIFDYFNKRFDQLQKDPNLTIKNDDNFNEMLSDAEYIIGEFCGEENWKGFKDEFWSLCKDLKKDKQANAFFSDLKTFIKQSFENPDRFKKESERQRLRQFVDRSYSLFDRKTSQYGDRFHDLYDYLNDMFDYASEQTADLQYNINKFARDLVTDNYGKPSLYITQESMIQFKRLISPLLQEGLANIPLPMISGSNDTYDWSIENVFFDSRGILPENFHLRFVSDLNFNSTTENNEFYSELQMRLDDIDLAFKSIKFHYLRKSLPSIEDRGIADCYIKGLKFGFTWAFISEPDQPFRVKLKEVKTYIDSLDIKIIESDHSIIDSIVTTLFPGYIKDQIASSLVGTVKNAFEPFNYHLNEYFKKQRDYWEEKMSETWDEAEQKFQQLMGTTKKDVKKVARDVKETASEYKDKAKEKLEEANQWFEEKVDWSSHWKSK